MNDTVKFGYSSWANITFRGEVDSGVTPEDWAEMSGREKDEVLRDALFELVDIWVEGE